jgi:hypothetical protein
MESNYLELTDHSDPQNIREAIINIEEITGVEKTIANGNAGQAENITQYVVAIYTRNPILGKKSHCLALFFDGMEERDKFYETVRSKLSPLSLEGKWHLV